MGEIDRMLAANQEWAQRFPGSKPVRPARAVAIVACMDSRMPLFGMLGLEVGDAHVIRNAGGVITEDTIRSLTVSQHVLGTREILLVHHTECGLQATDDVAFAVLTTPRSHYQSETMFTVRDRRPAGIVYMSSVNTYQAYNNFPYDPPAGVGWDEGAHPLTGRSLYDFNSPVTPRYPDGRPAVKVSFDRPYSSQYGNPGNGGLTDFEPFLIAFLEKRGYDVTYITDVDADVRESIQLIQESPYLLSKEVRGTVYDVETGHLREVS